MSPALASAAVFGLYALLALPAILALMKPRFAWGAVPFYAGLFLFLVYYHVGFSVGRMPVAEVSQPDGDSIAGATPECQQALKLLGEAGMIVRRPDPSTVVVRAELWKQVPKEAQDFLIKCIEADRPPQLADARLEVVQE